MSEIADFLRARYQERRAIAQSAKPGPWYSDGGSVYATHPTDEVVSYSESADHIAANDPADAIADCDAKLKILDEVVPEIDAMEDRIDGEWGAGDPVERESMTLLRILAQSFAGHPDHKGKEWAP